MFLVVSVVSSGDTQCAVLIIVVTMVPGSDYKWVFILLICE